MRNACPPCRQRLRGIERPHVWAPQAWKETPASAYLLRQHLWSNLYDRLGTRPFLTGVEKVGRFFSGFFGALRALPRALPRAPAGPVVSRGSRV
jgi:hypothetical protein